MEATIEPLARLARAASDTAETITVTPFELHFPLPYRICALILMGIWGWGLNVKILTSAHIDVGYLVKYSFSNPPSSSSSSSSFSTAASRRAPHDGIFHMAAVLTLGVFSSWFIFALILLKQYHNIVLTSSFTKSTIRSIDILPESTLFILILAIIMPGQGFHSAGRRRFLDIFRRILIGKLDIDARLPDILVADALTSYTRVLLDMGVTVCMFFAGHSCVGTPDRVGCSGPWTMGIILSLPYLIRFKQCMLDYSRTGANTHIVNCMKYASALPVVIFGVLEKVLKDAAVNDVAQGLTAAQVHQMWIAAALVNSFYSFIWDVSCDWNLELLTTSVLSYRYRGLRSVLHIRPATIYYFAVVVDFSFRMLWALKLTTRWSSLAELESGLFLLEALEICRRIQWMCIRIEKEWIVSAKAHEFPSLELGELALKDRPHNN